MGILSAVLTLPLAPVRGVVWLADQIRAQAELEMGEQGIRRRLEELQVAWDEGMISDEGYVEAERVLLDQLLEARSRR